MRKFFAAAMGSMVALAGFAGAANASATVDLLWIDVTVTNTMGNVTCLGANVRDCPPDPRSIGVEVDSVVAPDGVAISSVFTTDNITLAVVLTAGPLGSIGGGVSVNYGDGLPKLGVTNFTSFTTTKPFVYLPLLIGSTTNQPPYINNVNAAAAPPTGAGLGLPAGGTAYLGTVSFHKDQLVNGTFEIIVGTDGPGGTDDVLDGNGGVITGTTAFNSAYLVNVPEPGALSLLVMGLGGMLLAGRGRRS
jgi:hypothetical protein